MPESEWNKESVSETQLGSVELEPAESPQFRTAELTTETPDTYENDIYENPSYDYNENDDQYYEQPGQFSRMWELLSRDKEKQFIFADDELYDVVEITPDDIDKMPNTNWHLKNNSFVNHGYYNFRHLIAGKMYNDENNVYFIGVPGIYNRRERSIASMYGFNRFKFSMRSDMRLNQFGYWYREITD